MLVERTIHSVTARAGTMFGFSPRLEEHAVDPLVGQDVLPQGGDVEVAEHGGVEGVATPVREGRGVGGLAGVGGDELLDGDHLHAGQVVAGRVHHQGGVDAVEGALAGHEDLAAAALLGRRAEHDAPGRRPRRPRAAAASPAPSPAVAMMLWPQAWPMPGRASYSSSTAMVGPRSPARAANAVSTP